MLQPDVSTLARSTIGAARKLNVWDVPGGRWVQLAYMMADLLCVSLAASVSFSLRFTRSWLSVFQEEGLLSALPNDYAGFLLIYLSLIILLCHSQGLYRTDRSYTALNESFNVFKAVFTATLLLTAFIYLSGVQTISRLVVGGTAGLTAIMLASWRFYRRYVVERRIARGVGARNILIVGAGKIGQELADYLEHNPQLGLVVIGFLDRNHVADPRVLGRIDDLPKVARAYFIDELLITIPSERELVKQVAVEARRQRLEVKLIPEMYDGLARKVVIERVGDFKVMALHREPIPALGLSIKRTIDLVGSSLGLVLLSPLLAVISFAIKLDSPGPVHYRSRRVGKKGRHFTCYKFRTMVANADELKEELRARNERRGPTFKIAEDPRLTRLGRWLRKYSLDELPQLWNVLKGDMSLVGPRPHPLDDCEQYSLEDLRRLDVIPGMTGLWQVSARRDASFDGNVALDLQYVENWGIWLDLKILLKTVPAVISGEGQ